MRVASAGHVFFAITMIALGIIGLIQGKFTPTWAGVPNSLPMREVLAYLCAFVSLLTGIGLLWPRAAVIAASVLLIYLLIWLLLFRLPNIFRAPTALDTWWSLADTAVMTAGAWVLYAWFANDRKGLVGFVTGDRGPRITRLLYGLALITFGVAHFIDLKGTAALVPSWLPWHVGWAYFTGGAFIAAGFALLIGMYSRLAAVLSAFQLGCFTVLVWTPVVVARPTPFQWSEFLDSWALTAGAWVVADSYRGMPWLAVGKRWCRRLCC